MLMTKGRMMLPSCDLAAAEIEILGEIFEFLLTLPKKLETAESDTLPGTELSAATNNPACEERSMGIFYPS